MEEETGFIWFQTHPRQNHCHLLDARISRSPETDRSTGLVNIAMRATFLETLSFPVRCVLGSVIPNPVLAPCIRPVLSKAVLTAGVGCGLLTRDCFRCQQAAPKPASRPADRTAGQHQDPLRDGQLHRHDPAGADDGAGHTLRRLDWHERTGEMVVGWWVCNILLGC